jgi:hypothetical protein
VKGDIGVVHQVESRAVAPPHRNSRTAQRAGGDEGNVDI